MIQATHDGSPKTNRRIVFDTPDREKLTPEQFDWLTGYIARFESALRSTQFRDPETGYPAYIDRDSWIQLHLLHTAANNVETSRKSIYYYKDRLGRLKGGPLWDFDWAMNKYGATGWPHAYKDNWWSRLFDDPDFQMGWEDRWFALREGPLSDAAMTGLIDGLGGQIREAWERDALRWPMYAQDYAYEVSRLKSWFRQRFGWIDNQFQPPPEFQWQPASGDAGPVLRMSHPEGYEIVYTLDGSDPRLPGGGQAPQAHSYRRSLSLPQRPVRVRARGVYQQSRYTYLTPERRAVFWSEPIPLQVTDVHYHAPEGNAYEFMVLSNLGDEDLALRGYALRGDIGFDFNGSSVDILAPGASLSLVRDMDTYAGGDDPGLPAAGEYTGNLNNQGGCVDLVFHDQVLTSYCYPAAD
jgi:hypothetical protein